MRRKLTILFFFILSCSILLSSCSESDKDRHFAKTIEDIWQLSDKNIAQAKIECRSIADSVRECKESVRMQYDLLCIRIRDKQDIIPSSDDSVKRISTYFEKHGTTTQRMRAYHYMASVYRDLHNSPQAIVNDLKVIDAAKGHANIDSAILRLAYGQLGVLYRRQLNTDDALKTALRLYEIDSTSTYAVIEVANTYFNMSDSMQALRYYDKCYDMLKDDSLFNNHPAFFAELLARYTLWSDTAKSSHLASMLKKLPNNRRPSNYDAAMGLYHQHNVGISEAIAYYKHNLTHSAETSSRCDAAYALMDCYRQKRNNDSIAKYAWIFASLNEQVIRERQFDLTRNAHGEYVYQRDKAEEQKILNKAANLRFRAITFIGIVLVLFFAMLSLLLYKQKHNLLLLHSKNLEIDRLSSDIAQRESDIVTKEEQIKDLDSQIARAEEQIKSKILQNNTLMQYALMKNTEDSADEVIEKFKKASVGMHVLTHDEWQELLAAVDEMYPDFKNQLQTHMPRFNEQIIHTAYLLKAGLSNPQIVNLMDTTRQTVWYRTNQIKKAMGDALNITVSQ